MSVSKQLHKASFRNFDFLVSGETSNSGKKVVSHEYPNSNKRFSEDLGQLPPKFTLDIIVYGSINNRLRFEQLLRQPGIGRLVHPVYGEIDVMAGTYTVSSNQTSIGTFNFSVIFEVSEQQITAAAEVPGESDVSSKKDAAMAAFYASLLENYEDPSSGWSLSGMADRLTETLTAVKGQINKIVNPIQEAANELTNSIDGALNSVYSIAQTGETLKSTLEDVYLSISNVVESPADLSDFWSRLTDVGFASSTGSNISTSLTIDGNSVVPEALELPIDTYKRAELYNNQQLLDTTFSLATLANLYEAECYKDDSTDAELDATREKLDSLFDNLINQLPSVYESEGRTNISVSNDDVRKALFELRAAANKVLDDKENNAWKITTPTTKGFTSLSLLTYRYLGSLDDIDTLKTLNMHVSTGGFAPNIVRMIN